MDDIKKAIIGVITLAITTAGGVIMNKFLGTEDEAPATEQVQQPMAMPTIVINNENNSAPAKTDTVVKVVKVKQKPKPTATEKRKKEFDW